jgi:hypothetical protein
VNSNGQILKTSDGGDHWDEQISGVYLRCAGFANPQTGWVGTLTADQKLWSTVDGGATWNRVGNLPPSPNAIGGLAVVNESVVFASGTNYPNRPAGVIRTLTGTDDHLSYYWCPSTLRQAYFQFLFGFEPVRLWRIFGRSSAFPKRISQCCYFLVRWIRLGEFRCFCLLSGLLSHSFFPFSSHRCYLMLRHTRSGNDGGSRLRH